MPLEIELLKWYNFNKRDLPWRKNNDPYRVWVSEIILQQTRITKKKIDLNNKEMTLLEYFIRFEGQKITKTMLLELVWGISFDPTTSIIETHISRLRSKIEKPFKDRLIKTVRGSGYIYTPKQHV